jgi:MATE family multidrug resistance protein
LGIGLSCGYTLDLVLGFGNIGLWWEFAINLAVAAGVLTWRFSTDQTWQQIKPVQY